MIIKLDNSSDNTANQIYAVFQGSYRVEAKLIGTSDFPPLARSVENIMHSLTDFYAFTDSRCIAAIVEISTEDTYLDIHSLTVSPKYFRRGIADQLLNFILNDLDFTVARVETAAVNKPAINLYQKHGFVECKKWTPSHGIEKIALSLIKSKDYIKR